MKKIILASLLFMATGSLFAQTPSTKVRDMSKYSTPVAKTKTSEKVKATSAVSATPVVAKPAKPVITRKTVAATSKAGTVVLKKDGTADKRYKTASAPVKKDGTPDMRYKQNKKS